MKKNKLIPQNTIVIVTKTNVSSLEVDFEMYDDILGHVNVEKAYEEDGIKTIYGKSGICHDSYPIKIDSLKQFISEAEKGGSNYLSIDYNCDHPDYTFIGLDIHPASEDEIVEYENERKKNQSIKAGNLRKKIEEIQKEIDQLEK